MVFGQRLGSSGVGNGEAQCTVTTDTGSGTAYRLRGIRSLMAGFSGAVEAKTEDASEPNHGGRPEGAQTNNW